MLCATPPAWREHRVLLLRCDETGEQWLRVLASGEQRCDWWHAVRYYTNNNKAVRSLQRAVCEGKTITRTILHVEPADPTQQGLSVRQRAALWATEWKQLYGFGVDYRPPRRGHNPWPVA
jgi:hypothetical protein